MLSLPKSARKLLEGSSLNRGGPRLQLDAMRPHPSTGSKILVGGMTAGSGRVGMAVGRGGIAAGTGGAEDGKTGKIDGCLCSSHEC